MLEEHFMNSSKTRWRRVAVSVVALAVAVGVLSVSASVADSPTSSVATVIATDVAAHDTPVIDAVVPQPDMPATVVMEPANVAPDDVALLAAHNPCGDHSNWRHQTFSTTMFYGAFYFRVYKAGKSMDICTTAKAYKKVKGYKFSIVIARPGPNPKVSTKTKLRLTLGTTLKNKQCASTKVSLEFTKPTSPTGKGRQSYIIDFCVTDEGGSSGPSI